MERRHLIKQLIFIGGGAVLFPSCLRAYNSDTYYHHFSLTQTQLGLLANLSEEILPLEKNPRATEEKLHLFVIKMVDECAESKKRDSFLLGLVELQDFIEQKYGSKSLDESMYTELTEKLENNQLEGNIPKFYSIFKGELINGYMNSKYFMTNIVRYELIPGRYEVHYPVA